MNEYTEKHVFGAQSIAQYKLLSQILDDYFYSDTREMMLKYDINLISSNSIDVVDKVSKFVQSYTYDEETGIKKM